MISVELVMDEAKVLKVILILQVDDEWQSME
jgi:hypothetical protein